MTPDELAIEVAEELGVLGAGQSLSAEDQDKIDRRYKQVRALYKHRNWMYWGEDNEIPDGAETGTIMLVAYYCSRPFGIQPDEGLKMQGERDLALHRNRGYPRKSVKRKDY